MYAYCLVQDTGRDSLIKTNNSEYQIFSFACFFYPTKVSAIYGENIFEASNNISTNDIMQPKCKYSKSKDDYIWN